MDTESTIKRAAAGDKTAFGLLVRQFQGRLFGFLGRMGFSPALSQDLAQEAFIRAWQNLATYRPEQAAFSTWLFTIARNLAIDEMARHARDPARADGVTREPSPRVGATHDPVLEHVSAQRQLQHAIRQLLPAEREIIALAYLDNISRAQAATIAGCSEAAFRTRVHRAKEHLRQLLEAIDER